MTICFPLRKNKILFLLLCKCEKTIEQYTFHCQQYNNNRLILLIELDALDVSPDTIDLKILLNVGDGP